MHRIVAAGNSDLELAAHMGRCVAQTVRRLQPA